MVKVLVQMPGMNRSIPPTWYIPSVVIGVIWGVSELPCPMSGMKGLSLMVAPVTGLPFSSVTLMVHTLAFRAGGAGMASTRLTLRLPPVPVWLRPAA